MKLASLLLKILPLLLAGAFLSACQSGHPYYGGYGGYGAAPGYYRSGSYYGNRYRGGYYRGTARPPVGGRVAPTYGQPSRTSVHAPRPTSQSHSSGPQYRPTQQTASRGSQPSRPQAQSSGGSPRNAAAALAARQTQAQPPRTRRGEEDERPQKRR